MQRTSLRRRAAALAALLLAHGGALAARLDVSIPETASDRPLLRAQRLAPAPTIDGDVLGEAVWRQVEAATGFQQTEPFEGQPASERTEVRVGFDDRNLYIAAVCFDSDASTLVISDSRRDAWLGNEDSFRLVLDTFGDRQNAFLFGTNVGGIQYDGQVTNEGAGSRGSGANLDWNTSWTVKTRVGDFGWSAEMAIPFRSLRFDPGDGAWGINFERNIRRKNETAHWAHLGRQHRLVRVSRAGTLTGLTAPRQRNLQLSPYVTSSTKDDGQSERESSWDGGLDLKLGITPSLTLDVTLNTDFAQVEADDQQVNLDRFSLFFPEKRTFFLENADLFRVGNQRSGRGGVELFFSRRIGLAGGVPVPILGGLRLSGKVGRMNVGFLNMQTDESGNRPGNNFTVARLSREYRNRSRAGVLVVNRQGTGDLATDDDFNRAFAVDGQVGIGDRMEITGWAAKTRTPGLAGREHGFGFGSSYSSPLWRWRASYNEVGEDFNPEVGFTSRTGYRHVNGFGRRRFRPSGESRVKEYGPRVFYDSFWGLDGFHQTQRLAIGGGVELRSGAEISMSVGGRYEGLQEPFEIRRGIVIEPGKYDDHGVFLFVNTNPGRAVSLYGQVQSGGFFGGRQFVTEPALSIRLGNYLTSDISWSYNDFELAAGAFKVNLGRLRVTYAFSTSLLLQALIQYNDSTDSISTNLRFSWLSEGNRGLFLVYNEISEFGFLAQEQPDRSLIVKWNRAFDVFR